MGLRGSRSALIHGEGRGARGGRKEAIIALTKRLIVELYEGRGGRGPSLCCDEAHRSAAMRQVVKEDHEGGG